MKIGILSDSHNHRERTERAVDLLREAGAQALFHCGDLASEEIVATCAVLPFYFSLGNHDADMVRILERAADQHGAHCLGWGGEVTLAGKRIAVVHGHISRDLKPLLEAEPDYLLTGHSHQSHDFRAGVTRRINPGALFRAKVFTVAVLDLATDELELREVAR
ncbi:metallophosphoesterase family protein [Gimesia maris]|uniref:metallophosphoesterase family protein n=1 Tax=Gimesia maris TaxID=122 RepID=UPI00241CADE2|nr:metallophosphoesterase family protein [Gimesia maris]|tara:strand:+ start:256167 stop:256655 length:489 start_codon:yes stop_codon:yes gene_type:complete